MPVSDMEVRRLSLAPGSFDRTAGTVQAILSTGAPVQRGGYVERLTVTSEAVQLAQHLPVLDAHRQGSIADVLGRVIATEFQRGNLVATLRITSPAALDAIERGDITGVSIGYRVTGWADTRADGVLTRTAVKWVLLEVSLVPLPADSGAVLRSEPMTTEPTITPAPAPAPVVTTPPASTATRAEINTAIRSIATASSLGTAWSDAQVDAGATVEQARAAAFQELVTRGGGTIQTQRVSLVGTSEDPSVQRNLMAEALAVRAMPSIKISDAARPYLGLSMLDLAGQLLQLRGERVSTMSREALAERAMHTTSDFPNLLTGTGNRVLMAAYQAAPNPLKQVLARQTTLNDFRPRTMLKISDMPKLQRVTEHGEIKSVTRSETTEGYALDTFAMIFALTRKAIINDDLGAFSDWSVAMGKAASETEADQLVQLLNQANGNGPVMGDGKTLFHATHGNLATAGGGIANATLSAARLGMRNQKGIDGKTPINATPKYILVSPERETEAEQALAALYAATANQVSVFSGKLELLVEARLTPGAWYVFADPAVLPVLEYAYLSSAQGPQISTRDGWETLGTEFRVVLDFGCGAIDWRGAYRNAGA